MLPKAAHRRHPWRIHELAPDFDLYDVWALPTPGGPDDFPRLVEQFLHDDPLQSPSAIARVLIAVRWKLGEWFGWDDPAKAVGARVTSLRERLPADLRDTVPPNPQNTSFRTPFNTVYVTETELAAELANQTVHAIMHVGWVADAASPGGYRGQMAVLVKPNGWTGRAYMAAIAPFRHFLVYPPMLRGIEATWRRSAPAGTTP